MKADRIYIIIPRMIEIRNHPMYHMPAGRMGAQCAHAAAKLALRYKGTERMTVITLEVPESRALRNVCQNLKGLGIKFIEQYDNLPGFPAQRLQAIITAPISKDQSDVFGWFSLWRDS